MANREHLDILAKGVEAWNAWRRDNFAISPDLSYAHLRRANLTGVDLSGAELRGAELHDANLRRAILTDAELRGAELHGAELHGAELKRANLSFTDLRRADLRGADLRGATLVRANLYRAGLIGAGLISAGLIGAELQGADLHGADLRGAYLSHANLSGAALYGADLSRANLSGAYLSHANLSDARVSLTVFADVDLSDVRGLDSVKHGGPSSIGLDTIYRSNGKIPETFLRGAGVPENFIAYMRSLTSSAFEFYSCFISYSTADQPFADRLYADLQARSVRCWFAPHDMKAGRKVHEQIDEAIRVYDKLLLILSDTSMNSPWVKTEIANARAREQQQRRQMLFPISLVPFEGIKSWKLFDADAGIDAAREIREYYVPDFSNWKDHDSYTAAFGRLVGDLKAQPRG
jgi:uncharacterized protein YjbI with pentapeptide repeats